MQYQVEKLETVPGAIFSHLVRLIAAFVLVLMTTSAYSASKTLLVLGDSLSAEYGIARGAGWVARLEERLKAEKINARLVNASISGETTSGGRTRLPALLAQHKPSLVLIELGANDGLRGLSLAAAEANLRAMIEASRSAGADVLLLGMRIPPNYGKTYADQFWSMYKKIARTEKVPLVPFLLEGVAEKTELFQADRIHPLAEAHPIMLNNIWPHLKPLLSR